MKKTAILEYQFLYSEKNPRFDGFYKTIVQVVMGSSFELVLRIKIKSYMNLCEQASDCCLMPSEQLFSYIVARTSWISMK